MVLLGFSRVYSFGFAFLGVFFVFLVGIMILLGFSRVYSFGFAFLGVFLVGIMVLLGFSRVYSFGWVSLDPLCPTKTPLGECFLVFLGFWKANPRINPSFCWFCFVFFLLWCVLFSCGGSKKKTLVCRVVWRAFLWFVFFHCFLQFLYLVGSYIFYGVFKDVIFDWCFLLNMQPSKHSLKRHSSALRVLWSLQAEEGEKAPARQYKGNAISANVHPQGLPIKTSKECLAVQLWHKSAKDWEQCLEQAFEIKVDRDSGVGVLSDMLKEHLTRSPRIGGLLMDVGEPEVPTTESTFLEHQDKSRPRSSSRYLREEHKYTRSW